MKSLIFVFCLSFLVSAAFSVPIFDEADAEQEVEIIRQTRAIPSGSCGINKWNTRGLFGEEDNFVPFIVGGQTATANTYPWIASLQWQGYHVCGGSVYNDQYILTAAHCFEVNEPTSPWTVKLGKHNLGKTETTEASYTVTKIIRHASYNDITSVNDIALMKLSKKINYTDFIQPICMPPSTVGSLSGQNAIAAGWGATSEGGSSATLLQEVTVPIITNTKCQQKYPEETITSSMLCAGYDAGGKDSCQGDSGGPLMLKVNSLWTQVGVVSWGYGCAQPNWPGVYTRVSSFLDWLKANAV